VHDASHEDALLLLEHFERRQLQVPVGEKGGAHPGGGEAQVEDAPRRLAIASVAHRKARGDVVDDHRLIERTDRERAGFIRAIYHRPWDDPAGYDVTCDTSLLEQAAIIDDIAARLAVRDRGDHEAARRILELRLAAARVRAALFTDRHLQLPTLEVLEEGQGILVRGVVHRPEEKGLIQKSARAEAGDHPVRFDLRFR
jgi:hypothetical protein